MAGEKDWAADKNEATEALDFPRFFGSMFQLCDNWCDSMEVSRAAPSHHTPALTAAGAAPAAVEHCCPRAP